ncbi:hypothetical protein ABFS83_08G191000 [Erythranthe nasuta]
MDSVTTTPRKSRLARTFAKVRHIQAVINVQKTKIPLDKKKTTKKTPPVAKNYNENDAVIEEAFLAKVFATVSSIKAAYAEMQFAQLPYDADGIHSADQTVVSELGNLSELKQSYFKKQFDEMMSLTPHKSMLMSEIQEQKSLLKTYEITAKKLDSQLKLKDSEITFLEEKLADVVCDNKSLEKRILKLKSKSNSPSENENSLRHGHFVAYFHQAIKSIRRFVRLLVSEMQFSGWDLEAAAGSIEPGVSFWKPNHICFAFESFVCRVMFDGFNNPNFSDGIEFRKGRRQFSDGFTELKSVESFAEFRRAKYLKLMHPKMEESLFGNLDVRNRLVGPGGPIEFPKRAFFAAFGDMANCVWVLHCHACSFDSEVSVFRVDKGSRFSEVYMESLSDEAFLSSEIDYPRVAFMVVPGFSVGGTLVQCQVYLC